MLVILDQVASRKVPVLYWYLLDTCSVPAFVALAKNDSMPVLLAQSFDLADLDGIGNRL